MNELFRTFNPHEETTRAAREWNQGPSYEDYFTPQFDRGITNANVNDRSLFKEVQENTALGAAPYDQYQRTSRDPDTWGDAARSRDFLIGLARHHGTAQDLKKVESWPYTPPEVLGYFNPASWPVDESGFNPELIGEMEPYGPWSGSGFVPRITGPQTWDDEEEQTVGFDWNLNDPFGLGGELLLDYNVRPSDNIRDMTHPLQGDAEWDAVLKYVKRFGDE